MARAPRAGLDLDHGGLEPSGPGGARARVCRAAGRFPRSPATGTRCPGRSRPVLAALVSLRVRLPGIVRRRAPELGVRSIWAYEPVITGRLARACHDVGLELIAWTVDDLERMRRSGAGWAWTGSAPTIPGYSSSSATAVSSATIRQPTPGLQWPRCRSADLTMATRRSRRPAGQRTHGRRPPASADQHRAGHRDGADRDGARGDRDRQRLHGAERRAAGDRAGLQRRRRHGRSGSSTPTASSSGWRSSPAAGSPTCSAAGERSSSAPRSSPASRCSAARAQTAPWLIATRVGMGIGGALMWPAILGMTYAALPDSKAGLAGGLILGAAGIGNAMGPLLGGVLTDELSWRWIFFVNVPIAAFAVLVTWAKVHQPRPEVEDQRIDYPGIATLSTGLLLILLAFDQAADWGFGDPRVIAMLVVAAGLIVVLRIHRAADEEERADPERGDPQRRVPLSVPHRAPHVGRVLRDSAVRAAVHGEDPRLLGAQGGGGHDPDARHVRDRLVLRRARVPAPRREAHDHRRGPGPDARAVPPLDGRRQLRLWLADRRPRRDRGRGGLLLLRRHHGGCHRARSLPREPRGRAHLHVPDRRRRDRPRDHHDDLHPLIRERASGQGVRPRDPSHQRSGRGDARRARRHGLGHLRRSTS